MQTAHAWLLTDANGNQITSFYAGAMNSSVAVPSAAPALWHIAPEDPSNMVRLALAARAAGAEYFFDPGQALPSLLNKDASHVAPLSVVLREAKGIFLNEYEAELLRAEVCDLKLLLTAPDQFIVRTRGSKGVELIQQNGCISLPPATPDRVVDPTGCGDAFRAGFLHAYVREHCLEDCVALGAVMGAVVVGCEGGQNYVASPRDLYARWSAYRSVVLGSAMPAEQVS
jgi:adenosine kinase